MMGRENTWHRMSRLYRPPLRTGAMWDRGRCEPVLTEDESIKLTKMEMRLMGRLEYGTVRLKSSCHRTVNSTAAHVPASSVAPGRLSARTSSSPVDLLSLIFPRAATAGSASRAEHPSSARNPRNAPFRVCVASSVMNEQRLVQREKKCRSINNEVLNEKITRYNVHIQSHCIR